MTFCHALKLKSPKDGKMYKTDVADMQGLFRIIQSIPSPKAEPFKMWLAEVGKERVDDTIDPELTIDRALETYLKKRVHKRMDQSKTWSGMTTRQYKDLKSMRMRKYYYIAYLADRILLEILFGKKEKVDEMIQDIWH